jgi:hypothetical protein
MYSKLYIPFTIVLLTLISNVSWAINDSTVVDGIAVEKTDEF